MKALKPSFTVIELIVVLIIIGILAYTVNFNFFDNNLKVAADQLENHIRYAESLAFKDDKYRPFPKNTTQTEIDRSKYWFMQWWQVRFTKKSNGEIFYEVFSDSPDSSTPYDRFGNPVDEFAKDPLTNQYLDGNNPSLTGNNKLNLTQTYGIKVIKFNGRNLSTGHPKRIVFDNFGNVFLHEGYYSHSNNEYSLDKNERPLLTSTLKIQLCKDTSCNECIQLNISPAGEIFQSACN